MKLFTSTHNGIFPCKENYTPNYIVKTDFETIGIITEKCGNAGMIDAIVAVQTLTNCEVLSIKHP
jgi:hypothetical protein